MEVSGGFLRNVFTVEYIWVHPWEGEIKKTKGIFELAISNCKSIICFSDPLYKSGPSSCDNRIVREQIWKHVMPDKQQRFISSVPHTKFTCWLPHCRWDWCLLKSRCDWWPTFVLPLMLFYLMRNKFKRNRVELVWFIMCADIVR